jgi:mannitol 2-dehydrogenase
MKLNQKNLSAISERLSTPSYDRQALKTGIVHIGVGGFHRSHQAYYLNQLLEKHNELGWGICGVGLREGDRKIGEVLKKQDCLYTLVTQYPDGSEKSEIIGSIHEFLLAPDSPNSVIDKMAHPEVKIVSLTVTEGGYNFNPNTGDFDFENPDVKHELAHPNEPKTIYGYLTAALRKRKSKGIPPFTILSCDNIQHNGDVTRKMVLAFAYEQDAELGAWIEKEVSFPNTMVDRITPVTTAETTAYLKSKYDLEDEWCVVCEPFIQWVVEDKFCDGRPPLEKLGVQFVSDVTPYEKMKIRLLNAGHSVLGITGAIHGHPTIDACMKDEVFARFMRRFMDAEATPVLDPLEGIDIEKYKDSLEGRFANPNIKDSVSRICSESSAKLPKFLIPTLLENLEAGGSIKYATFILAAWCYYSDKQTNEKGEPLEIIDAQKEELNRSAKDTENDRLAFLRQDELFGSLPDNERFKAEYLKAIDSIYREKNIRKLMQ